MIKTKDYEITDYGIDNVSYFQGHGVMFTRFEYCCVGVGADYNDALQDALESASQQDAEIVLSREDKKPVKSDSINTHLGLTDEDETEECELYYYVGLRWNIGKAKS